MKRSNIKILGLVVISLFISIGASDAATIADSTCDTSYMESLKSRAWLEAQREITQNQNLIAKPDSVLSYSCFDQFAGLLAQQEKEGLFSGPNNKLKTGVADESILNLFVNKKLIAAPLAAHLQLNYKGKDAGGGDNPQVITTLRGGRSDKTHTALLGFKNSSYTCDVMQRVWTSAKCSDFIERGHDGFFTLKKYDEGEDKRELPASCGAAIAQWNTELGRSGIDKDNKTNTPWVEDKANAYSELSDPAACGETAPIATGIMVLLTGKGATPFPEKFCIQPGCYYDRSEDDPFDKKDPFKPGNKKSCVSKL